MSDTTTLTRCPHCQTRFRITEKQLGAAHGKVRCGQCREVFNAEENLEPEPEPEPERPEESDPPEPEQPEATPEEEELVFDDDPDEDAKDRHYAGRQSGIDESEFDEEFLALSRGESQAYSEFLDQADGASPHPVDDDESWAESLLRDDDEGMPEPRPLENEEVAHREVLQSTPEEAPSSGAQRKPGGGDAGGGAEAEEPRGDWRTLRTQPIAAPQSDRASWPRRLLWPAAALVAAAALIHQLGWMHWDRLARYEPIRPAYAQLCEWIGCELPPLQAIEQIQSRQMVVRSHPEQDNALLVEATLVNQARFDQPFPAIALSFANLNNDVVAQRVFQPREYLPSSSSPDDTIPAGTGVRVSLALQDPGRDAINYRLDFLPSQ